MPLTEPYDDHLPQEDLVAATPGTGGGAAEGLDPADHPGAGVDGDPTDAPEEPVEVTPEPEPVLPEPVRPDAPGVGDPPGEVTAVRHGELAALVSEVPLE
ncbi:hypothetical protein AB0I76_29030, partial [Micromonospora sp. NPDC049799]